MNRTAHKTDRLYHTGQRTLKMTGDASMVDVNAWEQHTYGCLDHVTLYPSPYMVLTEQGYTKHYYAGTERLAARLGCGGLAHIREDVELSANAKKLFVQCLEIIESNETVPCDIDCIKVPEPYEGDLKPIDPEVIPVSLKADVAVDIKRFQIMMENISGPCHWNQSSAPGEGGPTSWEGAEEVYFYHSDHLGSASWITDHHGDAIQHLQYLPFGAPFGAPFVDQRASGYQERFTFTGKERDEETGFGYFGARYMDHELMTMWLSVDPMVDKYPSISPYAYCAWNPVRLVDPDGMDIWDLNSNGELIWREASENDRIYARNGTYIDMDEGILTRGQSYTKDNKYFLFHLGTDGGNADKIFEFFTDNTKVEFSLIGYANSFDEEESQNFSLSCSFDPDGDTYGSRYSEKLSKDGLLRDHTHNHPDGDIWPSGIPSQEGIVTGTWNPEEKGQDTRFVSAMRENLETSGFKGVFQAYIYCPRNSKKRAYPGGYRCYTKGKNLGAKYKKNASSRYSR